MVDVNLIPTIRASLLVLHNGVGEQYAVHNGRPTIGSKAQLEEANCRFPDILHTSWTISTTLIENASEHITAFVKTITEPVECLASFTCIRSMLESCAIAAWLSDPAVDLMSRLSRAFALRYEGLEQQLKLVRCLGLSQAERDSVAKRIDAVENHAIQLGFKKVVDRNGKRCGIGERFPNTTSLISEVLKEEWLYRMLSAIAHGHAWAITQLAYKPVPQSAGIPQLPGTGKFITKTPNLEAFVLLGLAAITSIARPLLALHEYNGWDRQQLISLLESTCDSIGAKNTSRFWLHRPQS